MSTKTTRAQRRGTNMLAMVGAVAAAAAGWGTAPAVAAPAAAARTATTCAVTWGSLAKSGTSTVSAPLTGVRGATHSCYDRIVLDFAGPVDGFRVEYVKTVASEGSGDPIALRGRAPLAVHVTAPAYDPVTGKVTYRPAKATELVATTGWPAVKQVAWGGSFEGSSTIGVGVRARLPFRAYLLPGPGAGSRLVIDVAHSW